VSDHPGGALPRGWVELPLSECADRITKGTTPTSLGLEYQESGIPFVKIENLSNGHIASDTISAHIDAASHEVLARSQLHAGDLLFSIAGTIGRVALVQDHDVPANTNQALAIIRVTDELMDGRYLLYALSTGSTQIKALDASRGGAMSNISLADVAAIEIRIPPRTEQHLIVGEIEKQFTRLDAAAGALERAKANLKRCRSSATEAAFASCSAAPIRYLGDLGDIVGGLTKGQKRKPGTQTRSVPYLRVANVQRGHLDLDNIKLIDATEEEIRGLQLLTGDVLLNEGGDRDKLGRGWIWEDQIAECIHQNHVYRVRLNPLLATPKFVSHYANHFGQKYFFEEGKQTTNLASINMTKVRALPIPLPRVEEQERLVADLEDHLSLIDNLESSVNANRHRAARLRQAILQKAFEGKLVPQDPNDEPASLLLERIRAASGHVPARRASRKREAMVDSRE